MKFTSIWVVTSACTPATSGNDATTNHAVIRSAAASRTDPETGFYSTLPLLLGLLAIRNGKTYTWDEETHTAKA